MIHDYLVLGAGISGALICEKIKALDKSFVLVDKGRSPGGRFSCKRMETIYFNHGLQEFNCNFAQHPWVNALIEDRLIEPSKPYKILVPANQIIKKILQQTPVCINQEITSVVESDTTLEVTSKSGQRWVAKKIICTFPAPQALKIFSFILTPHQKNLLESVKYLKKIIIFTDAQIHPLIHSDYQIQQKDKYTMICFSEKISDLYFDQSDSEIVVNLKNIFSDLFQFVNSQQMAVKKWRYSTCSQAVPAKHLVNQNNNLFLVGDYFGQSVDSSLERTLSSAESIFSLL